MNELVIFNNPRVWDCPNAVRKRRGAIFGY